MTDASDDAHASFVGERLPHQLGPESAAFADEVALVETPLDAALELVA